MNNSEGVRKKLIFVMTHKAILREERDKSSQLILHCILYTEDSLTISNLIWSLPWFPSREKKNHQKKKKKNIVRIVAEEHNSAT